MIQPWSVFYDEVMPHLPGCTELPIVENAIRNAAIEFCKKSTVLQVDLDAFATVSGQALYDLAYDANLGVTKIISGTWSAATSGGRLWPTSPDLLDSCGSAWELLTGTPSNYYLVDPDQVRLVRVPDAAYTINLKCAMKPLRAATGIEGFMVERYKEDIAAGALARMLKMPSKPWTNIELGMAKEIDFNAAITRARSEANRGFTRQSLRVQLR